MSKQSLPREYPSDAAVSLFVDYVVQRLEPIVRQGEKRLGLPACEIGDLLECALPHFYCDRCEVHPSQAGREQPTGETRTALRLIPGNGQRPKTVGKRPTLRVIRGGLDPA